MEMDAELLNKDDGLDKMFEKLDTLYKEDENEAALISYDKFEWYSRPSEMTINDYLIEFERMVAQLKIYKIVLPEPVLAYRVLRSANLTEENEKLVRATVKELSLSEMSTQQKKSDVRDR